MKLIWNLWTARGLMIIGFLGGYIPVGSTFNHIGDERFLPAHTWYHFFREGIGDLGAMAAVLLILFAAPRYRNPAMWWVMLVVLVGFYAPFWVGAPFMAELAAPSMSAELAHLRMLIPSVLGLVLARRHFVPGGHPDPQPDTA